MIPTCPLHKTELIPIDQYIWGCTQKVKNRNCPHLRYSPSELIDDKGKVIPR